MAYENILVETEKDERSFLSVSHVEEGQGDGGSQAGGAGADDDQVTFGSV